MSGLTKSGNLQNLHRGVQDPTLPDPRVPIPVAINAYLDEITGSKATKKAHRHDLREFEAWNEGLEQRKKKYVEEIDKAHLRRFFEYLVDDEPENCPFTAAWKLLRLNKFIRTVLHLDPGKGSIKKSDCKRELKRGEDPPEIYTRDELKVLFGVMTPEEVALFETLLKAGLRKQEVMFLEDDDLIVETLGPGLVRRDICVQSKPHWGFRDQERQEAVGANPCRPHEQAAGSEGKGSPVETPFRHKLWKTRLPHPRHAPLNCKAC